MAIKKKQEKICSVCGKTIDSIFDNYMLKVMSNIDICSNCGRAIEADMNRIITIDRRVERTNAINDLYRRKAYKNEIIDIMKDIILKRVMKKDKAVTITVKEGEKQISEVGILGRLTIHQDRENKVYFDDNQNVIYEPVCLSWEGPEIETKEHKNGKITQREVKNIAKLYFTDTFSGKNIQLGVTCNSKIFDDLKNISWHLVEEEPVVSSENDGYEDVTVEDNCVEDLKSVAILDEPVEETKHNITDNAYEYNNISLSESITFYNAEIKKKKGNSNKVIVAVVAALVVIIIGSSVSGAIRDKREKAYMEELVRIEKEATDHRNAELQEKQEEEERKKQEEEKLAAQLMAEKKSKYDQAVNYIIIGEYANAEELLTNFDYEDSRILLNYCKLQDELGEGYDNGVVSFESELKDIGMITNTDVKTFYEKDLSKVEKAVSIQSEIDCIEIEDLSTYQAEKIEAISADIQGIGERYATLLKTDIYEEASQIRSEIDTKTVLGSLILSIYKLDKDSTKWTKLEKKAKNLTKKYESLSKEQQNKVINYKTLQDCVTYTTAKREKAEEKKRRKAEAKAKAEEEARKEAEAARAAQEAYANTTVYVTPTGEHYHTESCYHSRGHSVPVTRAEAQRRGLTPCGTCHP